MSHTGATVTVSLEAATSASATAAARVVASVECRFAGCHWITSMSVAENETLFLSHQLTRYASSHSLASYVAS